jgi:alpha-beta hydrolase superfamily lysophospholipase
LLRPNRRFLPKARFRPTADGEATADVETKRWRYREAMTTGITSTTDTFTGATGKRIATYQWAPSGEPRAVVVIAHGFGEHAGRYGNVVDTLVPLGYVVVALDHRGHGHSEGDRALVDNFTFLLDDLDHVINGAATAYPGKKLFLLGHSMGGCIALASALRNQSQLTGLILSGPAASTHGVPSALQLVVSVIGKMAPKAGIRQLDASGVSRDADVVCAYQGDPLVFHGKMPAGTASALLTAAKGFPSKLPSLKIPLLVVHGSDDKLVSVESGRQVHRLSGSADKTLKVYDGLYHEVFNEPERAKVLADVTDWLAAHTGTGV